MRALHMGRLLRNKHPSVHVKRMLVLHYAYGLGMALRCLFPLGSMPGP